MFQKMAETMITDKNVRRYWIDNTKIKDKEAFIQSLEVQRNRDMLLNEVEKLVYGTFEKKEDDQVLGSSKKLRI